MIVKQHSIDKHGRGARHCPHFRLVGGGGDMCPWCSLLPVLVAEAGCYNCVKDAMCRAKVYFCISHVTCWGCVMLIKIIIVLCVYIFPIM